jgi:hypothetical protein
VKAGEPVPRPRPSGGCGRGSRCRVELVDKGPDIIEVGRERQAPPTARQSRALPGRRHVRSRRRRCRAGVAGWRLHLGDAQDRLCAPPWISAARAASARARPRPRELPVMSQIFVIASPYRTTGCSYRTIPITGSPAARSASRARTVRAGEAPGARVPTVMNGSLVAKLAAQCRSEWKICMSLGHMAEPAASPPAKKSRYAWARAAGFSSAML